MSEGVFKLKNHNSEAQRRFGSNDDTRKYLKVGLCYIGEKEVHSWHTKICIGNHKFNSVCFEEIDGEIYPDINRGENKIWRTK